MDANKGPALGINQMSPSQCRAARGLLKWTQPRLAEASGIGLSTINRYENETRPPRQAAISKLQSTFEAAGVFFLFADGDGGIGVRLEK
jgi:transcriptional regulator with XRE-family HTH domain